MAERINRKWKIREQAEKQGLTYEKLAPHLDLTTQTFYYRVKNGFTASELEKLETVLGMEKGALA